MMRLLKAERDHLVVGLTRDDAELISNALNEVINGIHIAEFRTRLGATREEANRLLDDLEEIFRADRPPPS